MFGPARATEGELTKRRALLMSNNSTDEPESCAYVTVIIEKPRTYGVAQLRPREIALCKVSGDAVEKQYSTVLPTREAAMRAALKETLPHLGAIGIRLCMPLLATAHEAQRPKRPAPIPTKSQARTVFAKSAGQSLPGGGHGCLAPPSRRSTTYTRGAP